MITKEEEVFFEFVAAVQYPAEVSPQFNDPNMDFIDCNVVVCCNLIIMLNFL